MQTDIELITLAGLAIGLELDPPYRMDMASCPWNPLIDDGDALRLAIDLKLTVVVESDLVFCRNMLTYKAFMEKIKTDKYAATRRAIVRAAAAVGKNVAPKQ